MIVFNTQCKKLDDKSEMLRFMSYNKGKRYRLMDDRTKKIKFRKDVTFDEERFAFPQQKNEGTGNDIVTITADNEVTP